ncbi:MAG: hypothetical protein LBR90_02845 [Elusimicrobiota bacterium]|jgi:hypothetical protein|nr:hypothetical protein [Elusimicrobiota bacterium]
MIRKIRRFFAKAHGPKKGRPYMRDEKYFEQKFKEMGITPRDSNNTASLERFSLLKHIDYTVGTDINLTNKG